ncbi:phosphatase PAP2 family protein [Legionella sp.]|uniref:phosphatase PAP2 family protein n=1 Tax=Legionella sp. TaxID=459 RepID=UPI003CA82722
MPQISSRCIKLLSGFILLLCCFIFLINNFIYQFPGNNFFPENIPLMAVLLILVNLGLRLSFTKGSNLCLIGKELLYFFSVMVIIALATNAVQLTPFPTIDHEIVALEKQVHVNISEIVNWTNNQPLFKNLLRVIYDTLPYQMSILPLMVIFTCRFYLLREYYFLLLSTTLFGFGFYYFFPTTAPASVIDPTLFSVDQIATGLKFSQIHHYIEPTTNDGGLIALPSFHAIWAILCVNLLREWIIPCIILAVINVFLIASCVLLGWHYCTDLVGSIIVLLISYYFLNYCHSRSSPNFQDSSVNVHVPFKSFE